MINLGLSRMTTLLRNTPQPWKAVHVAGTNGKGSTCAYIAALLRLRGASCGVFSSPHLIDRWDCVTINNKPVSEALFLETEKLVKERDAEQNIGASEFELLTATAFEIMNRAKVDYGVIEVGMGGARDATNALKQKAVTVITKIGLDHQDVLGNTVQDIARVKAGILRPGVPCVVDGSNSSPVVDTIKDYARQLRGRETPVLEAGLENNPLPWILGREGYELHQVQNIMTAIHAVHLLPHSGPRPTEKQLLAAIHGAQLPGRLQRIDTDGAQILLDGAHNVQSARILAKYVNKHLRSAGQPVTWVLAVSEGKDVAGIMESLLRPNDLVTAVQVGPVDGMPWVKPQDPAKILDAAVACGATTFESEGDVGRIALDIAPRKGGPVVVAGSLYLVSDVLRYMRSLYLL